MVFSSEGEELSKAILLNVLDHAICNGGGGGVKGLLAHPVQQNLLLGLLAEIGGFLMVIRPPPYISMPLFHFNIISSRSTRDLRRRPLGSNLLKHGLNILGLHERYICVHF